MEKSFHVNDKESKRLFIGISLADKIRSYFYDLTLKLSAESKDIKPVPEQNIHVTLKFLGNVKKSEINKIYKTISSSLELKNDFKFDISSSLDGFPKFSSSRILYGVIGEGNKKIEELYHTIEDSLSGIGFEKDVRKFIPHITIARMKDLVNFTGLTANLQLKEFKDNICDKVILF
ncbi:RNA 2',3'-cyclic phosphodiesterase [bacterium]|nr:RNA 2',3'-cyclic phosphodiesterase [bacterium]